MLSSADDTNLRLDPTHMSFNGQLAQHVFEDHSAAFLPPADVDAAMSHAAQALPVALSQLAAAIAVEPSIASDVTPALLQQVHCLVQHLFRVEDSKQRSRCCVLADVLHRCMRAMIDDKTALTTAPAVTRQWADASQHCLSRWEAEVFSMHDFIFGQETCNQSQFAEDIVLKVLHNCRARLAEGMLHALKATLPVADEIHFENYFYSTLSVGVHTQARSDADASRINYMQLQTFDVAAARRSFCRIYSPARMRDELRATIFEASDGAETREKMYDWLRSNVPVGFCDDLDADARQCKWLHEMCHDADYRVTDAALSFMLCRMRVLELDATPLCPSAPPAHECGAVPLENDGVAEDNGHEGVRCSCM